MGKMKLKGERAAFSHAVVVKGRRRVERRELYSFFYR